MNLVIDIDDDYYATITNKIKVIRTEISNEGYADNDVVPIGWASIADGTLFVERPKGRWIKEESMLGWDGYSYQCSNCGRSIHLDTVMEDLSDYLYCHCGAEMSRGEDDADSD